MQLVIYIYIYVKNIYIYLLISYVIFCFRVVKTKDKNMYIYFSSCNVFEKHQKQCYPSPGKNHFCLW